MLHPVTRAAGLAKMAARGIARFGPLDWLGLGQLRLSGQPDLGGAFEGQAAHVACFTGTDGAHRKTALQIMDSTGLILGFAKLSRDPHVRPWLRNEVAMLARVATIELRSADVPAVLVSRDDTNLTLLVTDSRKSPGHTAPREVGEAHRAFLAELRARTGRNGTGPILDRLDRRMASLAGLAGPDWTARLARICAVLRPVAEEIPVCLAHGDFTPWNTFLQNGRLYVFDWEYAEEVWPVGFDLTHYLLSTIPPISIPDSGTALTRALAEAHFDSDRAAAKRALLLALACHAVFYLGRLDETGRTLSAWPEGPARAALIDRLLAGMTECTR